MLGLAALLVSCGGNKKPESLMVTPETTEIKGALKGCYEVVQKDYTIKNNGWSDVLNVELKRTDKELPFDVQKATSFSVYQDGKPIHVGFGIELTDENGEVVEITNANGSGLSGPYSSDDIISALNLNPGETGIVRWSVDMDNEPAAFRITSAVDEGSSSSSSTSESTEKSSYSSGKSSSSDWSSVLDRYENYVDRYIAAYKKAMNGDLSAATEYVSLLEEAEELSDELDSASDEMTSAEINRYMRITQKMTSIAEDLF